MEGNQMSYNYKVLESVLKNIAKDGSTENTVSYTHLTLPTILLV